MCKMANSFDPYALYESMCLFENAPINDRLLFEANVMSRKCSERAMPRASVRSTNPSFSKCAPNQAFEACPQQL